MTKGDWMTVSYDIFFEWMKKNVEFRDNIKIKQDYYPLNTPEGKMLSEAHSLLLVPMSIVRMEYKGLEMLVKKGLVVGGDSPVEGNQEAMFMGSLYTIKELSGLNMVQVFVPGKNLKEGDILPLVARIRKSSTMRYIEYCEGAKKYLGF